MYSDISFQRIKLKSTTVYDDLPSTPLIITFDARNGESFGQITLHLENVELALALSKAINEVLEGHSSRSAEMVPA